MTDPGLYRRWLVHLFDRPDVEPAPFFGSEPFEAESGFDAILDLFALTPLRSGRDLAAYSEPQLANGFAYLFYDYASDVITAICRKGVAEWKRVEAVRDVAVLYRDCLAPRYVPVLSHLGEPGATPLNAFCCMLWDESPLCQWKGVVLNVMEEALYLPNPACVESALHGLNHRFGQSPSQVAAILDRYLARAAVAPAAARLRPRRLARVRAIAAIAGSPG